MPGTILDARVVTLTLDASGFQRQIAGVQKRLTETQGHMRKTGDAGEEMGLGVIKGATGAGLALRSLTQAFVALPLAAVAVAAAILKISAATTKADRDLQNLSRLTDISPARINAIGAVADRQYLEMLSRKLADEGS